MLADLAGFVQSECAPKSAKNTPREAYTESGPECKHLVFLFDLVVPHPPGCCSIGLDPGFEVSSAFD